MAKPTRRDANEPAWRQRAVSRSLNAARSRAEQRVQRFLDAAFELIDEKGTTEFTIQEVIDRSKQSLRGFYQYFDGKDELLLALFEETIRESTDDLRDVGRAGDRPARRACARSRSACTSGASPSDSRASAGRTTAARSRSSRCSSRSTHPDRVKAAMAPISRMLLELVDAAVAAGAINVADTRRAAALMQQTVMYSWFGNRLVQDPRMRAHRRGDLGVLPPRPARRAADRAQTRSRSSIRIALPRRTL